MRIALVVLLLALGLTGVAVAAIGDVDDRTNGARAAASAPPDGAPATCRHQSSAGFRKSARDLVVGPFVLVGGRRYSSPEANAPFGGQKYPVLVRAGHRVTVELPREIERTAALLYADDHWTLPDGERTLADGHRAVTFRACSAGRGLSTYDGGKVTFWSGFVLATEPQCLTLRVWIDAERTPRRVRVPLGRRCD